MTTRLIPVMLMMAMGVPGWAQAQSQLQRRFPLTAHLVAQALSGNGIQTMDEQVSLLARVVSRATRFSVTGRARRAPLPG